MFNPWVIVGVLVLVISVFIFGVGLGTKWNEEKHERAQLAQLAEDKKKVDQHDSDKHKEQVKTDAKVKLIYQTVDDCSTRVIPWPILDQLRDQ